MRTTKLLLSNGVELHSHKSSMRAINLLILSIAIRVFDCCDDRRYSKSPFNSPSPFHEFNVYSVNNGGVAIAFSNGCSKEYDMDDFASAYGLTKITTDAILTSSSCGEHKGDVRYYYFAENLKELRRHLIISTKSVVNNLLIGGIETSYNRFADTHRLNAKWVDGTRIKLWNVK